MPVVEKPLFPVGVVVNDIDRGNAGDFIYIEMIIG
jgi:hypothetical protein